MLTLTKCPTCGKQIEDVFELEAIIQWYKEVNMANDPTSYKVICPCGAVIPTERMEENQR